MKASETIVGQWYSVADRLCFRIPPAPGDSVSVVRFLRRVGDNHVSTWLSPAGWCEGLKHLPNCTGYDWKPEVVDPGKGWRLLAEGEVRAKGDQFRNSLGEWSTAWATVDTPIPAEMNMKYRRRIEEQPIDPGKGYRLLEPHEILQEGDERMDGSDQEPRKWLGTEGHANEVVENFIDRYPGLKILGVRRKADLDDKWILSEMQKAYSLPNTLSMRYAPAQPHIRVVEDLTENCEVAYFDICEKTPVQQIIQRVNEREFWEYKKADPPPIDQGYGWRLLDKDETIEKHDQFFSVLEKRWTTGVSVGLKVKSMTHTYRRRIDVGDGYRLVDLDEVTREGDERSYLPTNENTWARIEEVNPKMVGVTVKVLHSLGNTWKDIVVRRPIRTEKKYRPFNNAAEFTPFRGAWVTSSLGSIFRVNEYNDDAVNGWSWQHALNNWKFNDGKPFGIEVKS